MSLVKKSVVIEGHKNRQKGITSRGKKGFKQLDEKSRHEIKKVIQQSRNNGESVLDLSDRNIFSLCAQIADLNDTLKGKFDLLGVYNWFSFAPSKE